MQQHAHNPPCKKLIEASARFLTSCGKTLQATLASPCSRLRVGNPASPWPSGVCQIPHKNATDVIACRGGARHIKHGGRCCLARDQIFPQSLEVFLHIPCLPSAPAVCKVCGTPLHACLLQQWSCARSGLGLGVVRAGAWRVWDPHWPRKAQTWLRRATANTTHKHTGDGLMLSTTGCSCSTSSSLHSTATPSPLSLPSLGVGRTWRSPAR